MGLTTIMIVLLVVAVLGGGGRGYSRYRRQPSHLRDLNSHRPVEWGEQLSMRASDTQIG